MSEVGLNKLKQRETEYIDALYEEKHNSDRYEDKLN